MNAKRFSQKKVRPLCAEPDADDGLDPREFFREGKCPRRASRKTLQLCSQVADALSQVLSGECGDEMLRSLHVVSVTLAPDAGQLLVMVAPLQQGDGIDLDEVLARLNFASGMLRSLVAAAVTRRHAPRLLFRVVSPPWDAEVNT